MGKSSAPSTSTTTNVTKLPQWIEDGGKENYDYAKSISDNLAPAYNGNTVSALDPTQLASYDMVKNGATMAQPGMQAAQNSLQQGEQYQGQNVSAQTWGDLTDAQRNQYLNPYTQNVVDTSLAKMDQARQKALFQTGDQARSAGSFGGSRHALAEGATNAQSALDQAQLASQLYGQGYQNAQSTFATDADRNLTAARSNQTTDLQAQAARTAAATAGSQNAAMGQNSWLQGAAGMQAVGDNMRNYQQDLLNQQISQYDAGRNADLEKLGIRTSALSLTPYGTSSTSTTTGQPAGGNGLAQGIGALGGLASTIMPFMMMSDARTKTNIKPTGVTDPATGAPIYDYNYKGDATPRVGPMAQDLEKLGLPTGEMNGVKTVRPQDAATPTVQKMAAEKGAKTASFLGDVSGGPGLLGPAPKFKKTTTKGKK